MRMLHLTRAHHCALIRETPSYHGMLHKVKDYITYGHISSDVLSELIARRGRLTGDIPITDEYLRDHTPFDSIAAFSEAIIKDEAELTDIPGVKPVFRLHPPISGHRTIKRSFKAGGALGDRDDAINELIRRML